MAQKSNNDQLLTGYVVVSSVLLVVLAAFSIYLVMYVHTLNTNVTTSYNALSAQLVESRN
jgi:hypothetical protein